MERGGSGNREYINSVLRALLFRSEAVFNAVVYHNRVAFALCKTLLLSFSFHHFPFKVGGTSFKLSVLTQLILQSTLICLNLFLLSATPQSNC